jgi:hypothetical protein
MRIISKKNVRFTVLLCLVGLAGVALFVACKKDGNEKITKNALPSGIMELGEYENYFPDESTTYEKLFQVMQCVNEPDANPMPNMDLKEAVWFLEAFFNIGACSNQEYAMDSVIGKKDYVISVPIETGSSGSIILNGEVLQTKYRNLLNEIVSELCGEYAINYGDMYVSAVSTATNEVRLGLTVLYGSKSHKAFEVQKIADPQNYPVLTSPTPTYCRVFHVYELPQRDLGMESLLNQAIAPFVTGIREVKDYFPNVSIPVYSEHVTGINDIVTDLYFETWEIYGTSYRDYIYNNLAFYGLLSANQHGYAPLYAFCEVHYKQYYLGDLYYQIYNGEAYHKFGLETVHQIPYLAPNTHLLIYFVHTNLRTWTY